MCARTNVRRGTGAQVRAPAGLYESGFSAKFNGPGKDTDTVHFSLSTVHCCLDFFDQIRYTKHNIMGWYVNLYH